LAAIILSAGFSSRMEKFKPLLPLGSDTAIEHAVRCFWQADIRDIQVVTGYRGKELSEAVIPMGVKVVQNDRFEEGMYSSVQAGVRALGPDVEAFFLLPVDTPLVQTSTIKAMADAYHACGKGILYPTFHGKRGHPPLIAASYVEEILNDNAPDGLRGLLSRYDDDAAEMAVADEAVLLDMDVPADYEILLAHMMRRAVPTQEACRDLFREAGVDKQVWEHCQQVAGFALALARQLNLAGAGLDEALVMAGALLHDVARSQPNHAQAGARFIQDRGYPKVAELVAVHMDIDVDSEQPISEAEVVYLADKMTKDSRLVSIAERLADLAKKYQGDPEALMAASRRLLQAQQIKMKVEQILGIQVELDFNVGTDDQADKK
jgi:putative nucleotidyltransferase with HDIG domain